jgi:hypothetical protein
MKSSKFLFWLGIILIVVGILSMIPATQVADIPLWYSIIELLIGVWGSCVGGKEDKKEKENEKGKEKTTSAKA